jgi:inorganic pyrophosphatase/exopolyphosphatase
MILLDEDLKEFDIDVNTAEYEEVKTIDKLKFLEKKRDFKMKQQ